MSPREPMHIPPAGESTPSARTRGLESADGTSLHASVFAAPCPAAGLLLVHGLQSHSAWFEASDTAQELARAGISSLAYDRRGSGRSCGALGHAESAEDFLMDLDAARAALRCEVDARTPLHAFASCFGARAVLAYAGEHPDAFASLILTSPATHMRRCASYGLASRLRIALAAAGTSIPTPLRDEYFVDEGAWLDWIRRDPVALRTVTAGFLRSASRLTRRMWSAIPRLRIPLLLILSRRDAIVDSEAIRSFFTESYRGPLKLLEYDSEHYIDFTDARPAFAHELETWLLRPQT